VVSLAYPREAVDTLVPSVHLFLLVVQLGEERHPYDRETLRPEKLQIHGHQVREGDYVDEGPESPGCANRRPGSRLHVTPNLREGPKREDADYERVLGIQVDTHGGLICEDFNSSAPPGAVETQEFLKSSEVSQDKRPNIRARK